MRHAIQGGGKIPVNDSGSVPVDAELSQATLAAQAKQVHYHVDTLDMTNGSDFFEIPNTVNFTSIEIDLTGGTGGTVSVYGSLDADQSSFMNSTIAFRPIIQTDNFTTATTDLARNTYQRGKLAYTAYRVFVASTGTGTCNVKMIFRE